MSKRGGTNSDRIDIGELAKGARDFQYDIIMKSSRSQVILAGLAPGQCSSREQAVNRYSDKIVFTIEGEGMAKIGEREQPIHSGCLLMVRAGEAHQVINTGSRRLLYLDFLAPPAY